MKWIGNEDAVCESLEDNSRRILDATARTTVRAMHECIGNSTRSEDSRDGLRQCRHECIYASRLNKIKETPAHTRTSGAASSRGETGEGDLKTQLETAAQFPLRILPGWEHYPKPVPRANFIAPSNLISLWETILFYLKP